MPHVIILVVRRWPRPTLRDPPRSLPQKDHSYPHIWVNKWRSLRLNPHLITLSGAQVALAHIVGILTNSSADLLHHLQGQSLWFEARDNQSNWKLGPSGMLDGNIYTHGVKFSQYGGRVANWWADIECPLTALPVEQDWMFQVR